MSGGDRGRRITGSLAAMVDAAAGADARFDGPHAMVIPGIAVIADRSGFASAITETWKRTQENFVAIGRLLNRAKATLDHGEFEAMIERDLPFSTATARKLRTVAEAIDAGTVPVALLPPDYTTVYLVATMSDEERRAAETQGIIHPGMTRADAERFRRRNRSPGNDSTDVSSLMKRKTRLLEKIAEIDRKLRDLKAAEQ